MITLLALDDAGTPMFDHTVAGTFTALGVPSFAGTPDLLAAAIQKRDIGLVAASQDIKIERACC